MPTYRPELTYIEWGKKYSKSTPFSFGNEVQTYLLLRLPYPLRQSPRSTNGDS